MRLLIVTHVVHLLNALEALRVHQGWRRDIAGFGLYLLYLIRLGCTRRSIRLVTGGVSIGLRVI